MKRALRPAAVTLTLLLAACGGIKAQWAPYSALEKFPKTLKSCVPFYEADVQRLVDAGGVYAGKVTVPCVAFSSETSTVTRAVVIEAWPKVEAVLPKPEQHDELTLLVIHVPEAKWPSLPEPLRPKRTTEEFNW
jgi:hypothetical protein